jgi:Gpi18-like mannosyltransferase
METNLWALFDFTFGFVNIGFAIKHRDSYWSLINWAIAGSIVLTGILQITGRL